jgi:hypothetical protein
MLNAILFFLLVGAVVVGAAAASRRISPWWIFLAACLAGTPAFIDSRAEAAIPCGSPPAHLLPFWFSAASLAVGVTLYGAAAVDGIAEGVRGRGEVDVSAWFVRSIVSILASAGGAFVLFVAVLSAALHCD